MRKLNLFVFICILSLATFSCKDDEVAPKVEFPEKYSELSVEQNKAELEKNGLQLVQDMKGLKDLEGVDAASNLSNLLSSFGNSNEGVVGGRLLKALSTIQKSNSGVHNVFSAMRINAAAPTEEPQSIQEFFDIYAGTYVWEDAAQDWNFTKGGKSLIFKFPSAEAGTSNNAVLTIRDYVGKVMANPIDGDYTGDLPISVAMDMVVDGKKVLEYSFKAGYNSAGEPTSTDVVLTLAPYSFSVKMANNAKDASFDYTLKKNSNVLISYGAYVNGDFSTTTVESAADPGKVISEASSYFQILNIKVSGKVDVKNLFAAGFEGSNYYGKTDAAVKKDVELLNKYYKLIVFYADSKKKIADTEFYTYTTTECVYDWYYDDCTEREYFASGLRLVFADQTKSDFETYFSTGFSNFETEFEAFINGF